jgi:hypothetical protein
MVEKTIYSGQCHKICFKITKIKNSVNKFLVRIEHILLVSIGFIGIKGLCFLQGPFITAFVLALFSLFSIFVVYCFSFVIIKYQFPALLILSAQIVNLFKRILNNGQKALFEFQKRLCINLKFHKENVFFC